MYHLMVDFDNACDIIHHLVSCWLLSNIIILVKELQCYVLASGLVPTSLL